jgi:predicted ATPase
MESLGVIKQLQLRNVLSFGEESQPFPLGSLNVLIGPNGSGKSNLIEALGVLRAAPRDLSRAVREGGGIRDWVWKGAKNEAAALIEAVVDYPHGNMPLRYRLEFRDAAQRLQIVDERIENETKAANKPKPFFYFGFERGRPYLNIRGKERELRREEIIPDQSVLSQRKDPEHYPEITYLGKVFDSFRLYREWSFGRYTAPRLPQPADLPNDFLLEDASNLGLVLNRLGKDASTKRALLEHLKKFYEGIDDIDLIVEGGTVQIFLQEGNYNIPATRLSDGTLRWLSLLAVLLHPSPPALVCLEEPEIGLHPDMLRTLAQLLLAASARMQLVVTTHADVLVDALSETPEAVVVCEKRNGSTRLKRLDKEDLAAWLQDYSLGQLWRSGEIGGNRW